MTESFQLRLYFDVWCSDKCIQLLLRNLNNTISFNSIEIYTDRVLKERVKLNADKRKGTRDRASKVAES